MSTRRIKHPAGPDPRAGAAVEDVEVPCGERTEPSAEALCRDGELPPPVRVRVRVNAPAEDGARAVREFVTRPRER